MTRKTVFITGAAAGIGRAIACKFASEGWQIGAYDIDLAGVNTLRDELGADTVIAGQLDVTDPQAWEQALQGFVAASEAKQLHVLVNNAGILDSGPFQDIALTSHHRIADINFKAVMTGCHVAFAHLKGVPEACIINLASASAMYGQPNLASYAASKFAVRGLTEGLNLEWEPHGIRVLDIWPLFVATKMVDGMKSSAIDRMGVNLKPEDVAKTVFSAANSRSPKVHWTVGFETALTATLTRMSPAPLLRALMKQLTM